MSKIAKIAIQAVRRELPGFPTISKWCVAFTFEAVARALDTNRWKIYSRILDDTKADPDKSRWAHDVELGVQRMGWAISTADYDPANPSQRTSLLRLLQPGDLLFSSRHFDEPPTSPRTAPDNEGHIGIYVGEIEGQPCVAENTSADRGKWFVRRSALRLTPLAQWDTITTLARIPQNWRP
ncbi:hypothetical protein [Meiothermus cerbereus]|uniref:hypothetical protein n=1 Tax=Meiothermus cerbereus TaxID=65552 RepID=UPI0004834D29|nr:hypothetical protein [Meiothermus cerbereus]